MAGSIVHAWLPQAFQAAYADMAFKEFSEADATADPRLVESLSFHAVNGRRLKSSKDFLANVDSQWIVRLLALAMEPTRVLIYYWLSCLGVSFQFGERPALFKLIDPRCSVVCEALQHYSALLLSQSGTGRLELLWSSIDFANYKDFCAIFPERCRAIRRLLMLGAAWVFRRHFVYFNSDHLALMMCGDKDSHAETLKTFLGFWEHKNHCCFPPGLARDFKQLGLHAGDLTHGNSKNFLYAMASTLQLSIADVEAMHSQNRALTGASFASISAKFINAESKRLREEAAALQYGKDGLGDTAGKVGQNQRGGSLKVSFAKQKKPTPKGLSALEIYRKHFLEVRGRHETINPCSKEIWDEVRESFSQLSPHEKNLYESMSEDSKCKAIHARAKQKLDAKNAAKGIQSAGSQPEPASTALVPANGNTMVQHLQILPAHELNEILSGDTEMNF